MEKNTRKIEPGTPTPDPKYHLEITLEGRTGCSGRKGY